MLLKGNKCNDGDDDTKVNLLNTLKVWVMGKGIGAINYASFWINFDGDENYQLQFVKNFRASAC